MKKILPLKDQLRKFFLKSTWIFKKYATAQAQKSTLSVLFAVV